ncbi:MAG: hypothetical protein ACI36Z_09255 [Alloprevotella sp.]
MDIYSEIEKRIVEINRLINENEKEFKPYNGFSLFATCMFRRDGETDYSHTTKLYGEDNDISGNISIYMVDNPDLIPIMENAIAGAKHVLSKCPDVVDRIRNSEDIEL